MGTEEHRDKAGRRAVRCGVVTVSDTRGPADDASGDLIASLLSEAGHEIVARRWVRDDADAVRGAVTDLADGERCEAVLVTGGTGIARRDVTHEALATLLSKRMEGFGELFRMLSFAEVGPAAMLSRAFAGTYGGALVFALPGSKNAVRTAMTKLIVPELAHFVWEVQR